MAKLVAVVAVIFAFSVSNASEALAQRGSGGGFCPAGTCAQNGGPRAAELRHCKKENCPGHSATSKKQKQK